MNLSLCLRRARVIPVIEIDAVSHAVPLARVLSEAGLDCAEITFRTNVAVDVIAAITAEMPELTIGAGTVRTLEQADLAVQAGARFLVAPGLNPVVVEHAKTLGTPMIPGICTPTEIEQAQGLGLSIVKFFPAEAAGGAAYLKALAGPYPDVRFVPTGGIGPGNLARYLALPNVVACGGSWMAPRDLITEGDFGRIAELSADALALAAGSSDGEHS